MNAGLLWLAGALGADAAFVVVVIGKATVLLALTWAAHAALTGRNPRWRVDLWRCVTVGLVVIGGLALAPPILTWRLERSEAVSLVPDVHTEVGIAASPVAVRREVRTDSALSSGRADVETALRREPGSVVRHADATGQAGGATRSVARLSVARAAGSLKAAGIGRWLLLVWMAGAVILGARLVASGLCLSRVVRRSKDAPERVMDECRAIALSLGVVQDVLVQRSTEVLTPCLAGLRRHVLLLPARECDHAERADLRAILAHELAHARTHDLAWNAAMHATSLLLWFHPLVWRVRAAHAAACDSVCDSVAALLTGDVISYCRTLARLALQVAGAPAHGLAMARTSEVSRRIDSLYRKVFRSLPTRIAMLARFAVGALVVLIGGLGFIRANEIVTSKPQSGQGGDAGVSKPEHAIDLWKRLIGKPAPELRQIKAWDGGTPVTMADLRGKFVLLHFWNMGSGYQLGALMALHEQFADQGKGLVIIVVQRDRGEPAGDFQGWQGTLNGEKAGNRPVPFRLALDGGGATAIPGTDALADGATHAAFGVPRSAGDLRQAPISVLIGPDGKVLETGGNIWTLSRDLETAMGVKAKVPAWRQRFDQLYALRPGQVLKRVDLPYPEERSDYLFYTSSRWDGDYPYNYVFQWDGRLRLRGSFWQGQLRDDVLVFALGLRKAEIEGPRELLEMRVSGDWIVRPGARKADLLKALETIFRDEIKQPVAFTERDVERDVLVVKGRYRFHALGDVPGDTVVHIGTDALPPRDGGGGSGTLKEMFDWLGNRTNSGIVDESESSAGTARLVWRDHLDEPIKGIATIDEDWAKLGRVLENLTKQTELTFHSERRRVKMWVVSRER
jgi:beta-lactamase regulating signal transducer with metallopeptidase domain